MRRAVLLLLASEAGEEAVQQGQQEQGEGPEEPGVEETEMEATNPDAVPVTVPETCLLYTSDAADDLLCVDLGGRRIITKTKITIYNKTGKNLIT